MYQSPFHACYPFHVSNVDLYSITDRGVTQLTQACPRIRYIDLACCSNLTDLSVLELASLSKLRRVGLVRLSNLTDNAVFALGEKHTALERIHLSYCDNISVAAIHFLLQRLNKLTHLSLTGIPQFRRRDLKTFCRVPPKVRPSILFWKVVP
jgi:F-box and leucine-rich repeat protein GRR1